jgi:hypothetical protein
MSAPVSAPAVVALHSVDAAADTARVWVDQVTPDRAAVKAARKVAAQALHTIVGAPLTVTPDGKGAAYLVIPAIRSRRAATPAAPVVDAPSALDNAVGAAAFRAAVESPDVATLRAELDRITALLDALTGGQAAPAPAPAREVPEFIKRAQAITCRTCRDHGVVRGVGQKAGQPYRTADGAAAATAAGRSVKCPSHKRAGKAARKSA